MAAHWRLVLFSLIQFVLGFAALYNLVSLNVLQPFVYQLINDSLTIHYNYIPSDSDITWIWSTVTTSFLVGTTIGSLFIDSLSERFGRRITLGLIKNLVIIVGSVMQALSKTFCSFELLLAGRFIASTMAAFSCYTCVYMSECAPTDQRVLASALPSLGYKLWTLIGVLMGLPQLLGTPDLWPVVFLVPVIPAVLQIAVTPLFPESPKHLFITEHKVEEARRAVLFYHGSDADVEQVFQQYADEEALQTTKVGLVTVWRTPHLKWPLLLSVISVISVAFEGTDIVNQYSAQMLADAGLTPAQAAVFTALLIQLPSMLVMAIAVGLLFVCGRRKMLLGGLGTATIGGLLMTATGFEMLEYNWILVLGMALVTIGDSLGAGLIRNFLPAELCHQSSRSLSVSIAFFIDGFLSSCITFFWPSVVSAAGNLPMFLLVALTAASLIFLYFNLPETKNKSVNQVLQKWIPQDNEGMPLLQHQDIHKSSNSF